MIRRATFVPFLFVCSAGLLASVSGCEDSTAREREQVQAALEKLGNELQVAIAGAVTAPDEPATAQYEQQLSGLIGRLNGLSGGEDGQKAAKSLMAASALRELASIQIAQAEHIEADHHVLRQTINNQIDSALRLNAMAEGMQSINDQGNRAELQAGLESARQRASAMNEALAQLDSQISPQAAENEAQTAEMQRLRVEVGELLRKAQELGYSAGFDTYRQAAAIDRQADHLEYQIGQRDAELEFSLRPEHELASAQLQLVQSMVAAIEATQKELDAFSQMAAGDVSATRETIQNLRDQIDSALGTIEQDANGPLKVAYEGAAESLEKAATQAQAAAKGAAANAARLTAARLQEALGRLHWLRAANLAEHKATLQRLVDAGAALGGEAQTDRLQTASAAHEQAVEAAKASLTSAQELLEQVNSRTDQVTIDSFKANIEAAVAGLEGKPVEPSLPLTLSSGSGDSSASSDDVAAAPPVMQFATAQELVDFLSNTPQDVNTIRTTLSAIHAESADGKRLVAMMSRLGEAIVEIDSALQEQFGQGVMDMPGFGAGMMASTQNLEGATLVEETEDRAVYSVERNGQQRNVVLRKIGGSWKVDVDEMGDQTAGMAAMEPMMNGMAKAMKDVAKRIRAGEFATAEEAMAAMGQAMMPGMGGAGGPGAMTPPRR